MKIYPEELRTKKPVSAAEKKKLAAEKRLKVEQENIVKFPSRPVTQIAYARYCGVVRQTVAKWVEDGRIELTKDGKIIPRAADEMREKWGQVVEVASVDSETLLEHRIEKERHAARLMKVKADEAAGAVVSKDEIESLLFQIISDSRKSFQDVHKRVITRLNIPADFQREASEILRVEIEQVLERLASKLEGVKI